LEIRKVEFAKVEFVKAEFAKVKLGPRMANSVLVCPSALAPNLQCLAEMWLPHIIFTYTRVRVFTTRTQEFPVKRGKVICGSNAVIDNYILDDLKFSR